MMGKIVDLFAGGGGVSEGFKMGLGVAPDIAINHDPASIMMHLVNHPKTHHLIDDVWSKEAEPEKLIAPGEVVDCLWASPDCTHHSNARGGKPKKKNIRGLAWVVLKWAAKRKPTVIMLENVKEFQNWGPLTRKRGREKHPKACRRRKGETFTRFVNQLRDLGYDVEWRVLNCADYGAPTARHRFFMIARCDRNAIVWPEPSHGPGRANPYRTAAECIDFSNMGHSIFKTKEEAQKLYKETGVQIRRPLKPKTMERIARGIQKFIIDNPEPFVIAIDNNSAKTGHVWPSNEPLKTITQENRFAMVAPILSKYHGLRGNESRCSGINKPLATIDTSNRHACVFAFLTKFFGGKQAHGSGLDKPFPTITAVDHNAFVAAYVMKYYGSNTGHKLDEPLHTITAKSRFGLVTIHGEDYQIVDIHLRMFTPRELALAQGFSRTYHLTGSISNQVARIGNSVPPQVPAALAKANVILTKRKRRGVA